MMSERDDLWSVGEAYERYIGRWSRLVAYDFLDWLAVPQGGRWLDVGCGTGALCQVILVRSAPCSLVGIDPSEGFVAHARRTIGDPRVEFQAGHAESLPFCDRHFDAVVAALAINFIPDIPKAIAEMVRVTRRGGRVAAYVWDYAGEMQMMRLFWDAAAALNAAALVDDEGRRYPMCRPQALKALMSGVGLRNIDVRAIDAPIVFEDFDDFWAPFLGGQGPAPRYCISLSEKGRMALQERIRSTLAFGGDGRIHMIARAWAVSGIV